MLAPAILYKEEIEQGFKKYYYTDEMMYECGCLENWTPAIEDNSGDSKYQYAIINKDNKVIGYIAYDIDWYSSCASNFGLLSFDKGNAIIGKSLFEVLDTLLNDYKLHRISWRMVGGNPVEKSYDRFCKKYNGRKHILRDVFKDRRGKYHDDIIYEIIREEDENGK